jgi:hypothetical protein
MGLDQQSRFWATPKTLTGGANSKREERGAGGADLQEMVTAWPTPASRDHKGTNSQQHMNRTDGRTDGRSRNHAYQLPNFVMMNFSPPAQQIPDGPTSSESAPGSPPRLNPAFAAWLMGLPGWWTSPAVTSCAQSEMAQYRSRLQRQLSCLLGE